MKKQFTLCSILLLTACNSQWQHGEPVTGATGTSFFQRSQGYVSASTPEPEAQYVSALEAAMAEANPATPTIDSHNVTDASGLMGIPAGGKGTTLLDATARTRLNDALKTTPTGSSVTWQLGDLTYTLAPNSPVYVPQHSGGNCRDAILTIFGDGFTNLRTRSLFCQPGPSADWVIELD